MSALEIAIESAIKHNGDLKYANKAYLEFIKANLMIPIEKDHEVTSNLNSPPLKEPRVLYFKNDEYIFLPVFSNQLHFDKWAIEIKDKINVLKLSGVDLLKGIGDKTIISFNLGSSSYKEFNLMELARMRSMVLKLFS